MAQSGRGVTVETQAKVGTPKTANPFANVKTSDLVKYAGLVIAVDMATRQIVDSAPTAEGLKEKMKQDHCGVKYARVAIPKLKSSAQ